MIASTSVGGAGLDDSGPLPFLVGHLTPRFCEVGEQRRSRLAPDATCLTAFGSVTPHCYTAVPVCYHAVPHLTSARAFPMLCRSRLLLRQHDGVIVCCQGRVLLRQHTADIILGRPVSGRRLNRMPSQSWHQLNDLFSKQGTAMVNQRKGAECGRRSRQQRPWWQKPEWITALAAVASVGVAILALLLR